uniref:ABC transporter ATP-binding protein n=1 Tax=Desulfatirhabdium butyrativorans TaxID=340467 RepID=A0A7C4VS26_9BACT
MNPMLELDHVSKSFGGLKAVDSVGFRIEPGEIFGLLGPNGAGKTVCFNLISGVFRPNEGRIFFDGMRTDGFPSHRMAKLGLGRTFQIVKPFSNVSVLENVVAALGIQRYDHLTAIWSNRNERSIQSRAMELLEQVGLAGVAYRKAGLLPLGNLRRLEIARALAVGTKLILLDESFSGLRHEEILQLEALVRQIRDAGRTILLIEHNMKVAMGLCNRIVVLDHGRVLAQGTPEEIRSNPAVIEAYLGKQGGSHAA